MQTGTPQRVHSYNHRMSQATGALNSRGPNAMPEALGVLARPPIDPATTALVVVDATNAFCSDERGMLTRPEAGGLTGYYATRVREVMIPNIARLAAACREAGVMVVFMRVGSSTSYYRDALPALRSSFVSSEEYDGGWGSTVAPELGPLPGDLSLMKRGSGSFIGSSLDSVLRNAGICHVLYTGLVTNACVLPSVGEGFDLGYWGYLVSDATATYSQRLQDMSEEIISGYMAMVQSTDELIAQLKRVSATTAAETDPTPSHRSRNATAR